MAARAGGIPGGSRALGQPAIGPYIQGWLLFAAVRRRGLILLVSNRCESLMAPLIRTHTLGCKVNQYETEYVREGLHQIGYQDAAEGQAADLCVINTCTVTAEGDAKSRQIIRRMARENPAARLIVMGCYATREPERLAAMPQVAEVITDKRELPDLLGRFGVVDIPDGISRFGDRQRAYVKVQDGCLLRCSYCIIPQVRPHMISRPRGAILDEVRRLIDHGYREIVLTGVHLGHYGVDGNRNKPKSDWVRLSHLVGEIARLTGDFRLRLSSIEATEVTRELIEVMAEHPQRVCPHLHVCLQSGSDRILRRMNRRWGTQRFIDRCDLIRERLERPSLTTDVIVGFPGETEQDFEATCQVARRCGFSKMHIFPFSGRRGTPADTFGDTLSKAEKRARVSALTEVEQELRNAYFASLQGSRLQLLVESRLAPTGSQSAAILCGTSCRYTPTFLPASSVAIGELVDVIADTSSAAGIYARVADPLTGTTT